MICSPYLAIMPHTFISLWINIVCFQCEIYQSSFEALFFNLLQCLLSCKVCWLKKTEVNGVTWLFGFFKKFRDIST